MYWDDYNQFLLALVGWREARGEGLEGMKAVMCVVRNRVNQESYGDWAQVITAKWQFSSLTAPGDPELILWPQPKDDQFATAMSIAGGVYLGALADNTNGATHYFNPNIVLPKWAASMTKVASIGHHDFYK